jgi:hypothetical protein
MDLPIEATVAVHQIMGVFWPSGRFILFRTIKPDQSAFIESCFGHSGSSGAGDRTGTQRDLAGAHHSLRPTIAKDQSGVSVLNHRFIAGWRHEASSTTILSADISDDGISGYILVSYAHFHNRSLYHL